jgi:lysophospholipid acyltransferase (LPLAT)-like uncharacterized protein
MRLFLAQILVRILAATVRFRFDNTETRAIFAQPASLIFALWHNRLGLIVPIYRRLRGNRRVAAMVSASRDGERLAKIFHALDVACVRGSSSRRGRQALREMARLVMQGYDSGITPDGPRGPKYVAQDGVIALAQLTGAPIVPISYTLSRKITLKSWDNFMIPLPFSRCDVKIGAPIFVPRDASEAERETKRKLLEDTLKNLAP